MGWTGPGLWRVLLILDWIRTVKCFTILDQDQTWTELMDKNCINFVIKKFFCWNFGLYLDLEFKFFKYFGLCLELDWVLKIGDWIWIVKYDNPLISGFHQARRQVFWFAVENTHLRGKISVVLHVFKTIFSGHTTWGAEKNWRRHCPRMPSRGYGPDCLWNKALGFATEKVKGAISELLQKKKLS